MKKAALVPALALAASLLGTPAEAAPRPPVGYQTSSLTKTMADGLRALPCGKGRARADLVLYSNNNRVLNDIVIAKARCGVRVRLVTSLQKPDGETENEKPSPEMQYLINGLKKAGQTVKVGRGALTASGSKYIEHEKIVALDYGGRGQRYVLSDSGNWTFSTDHARNDRMTVRDDCLYAGTIKHIDVLQKDRKTKSEKPARSCDGKVYLWWMPTTHSDPDLAALKKMKCGRGDRVVWASFYTTSGSKTKYGSGRKLVDQLIRFKKAGADVRVAANDFKWSSYLRGKLIKAKIPVYDVDERGKKDDGFYMHRKMLAATGCSTGPYGSQGSATRTKTAYMYNGNQVLTTRRAPDATAMVRGFDEMVKGRPRYKK